MNQEMVMGMVLSAMPIGEYDKRLVILTKEHGKIAVFARGARRPNSPLLSCTHPFSFGNFTIYRGRDSYSMAGGEISNYFSELREDLEGAYYGFYFCEFADYFTRENIEAVGILKLLYQTLRCLTKKTIPYPLIRVIFELKIMTLNGEAPRMSECVRCGKKEGTMFFSARGGGFYCKACEKTNKIWDKRSLSPAAVYTIQYIIGTPVEKLYTFTVTNEVLSELKECLKEYLGIYVDHTFKSLEILELIG